MRVQHRLRGSWPVLRFHKRDRRTLASFLSPQLKTPSPDSVLHRFQVERVYPNGVHLVFVLTWTMLAAPSSEDVIALFKLDVVSRHLLWIYTTAPACEKPQAVCVGLSSVALAVQCPSLSHERMLSPCYTFKFGLHSSVLRYHALLPGGSGCNNLCHLTGPVR